MTIVLRTNRTSFAVLAAERLASWPSGQQMPTLHRKIVWHPNLPLAFGVAGSLHWVIPALNQAGDTTAFLRQLAGQIISPNELELQEIGQRVCDLLLPGYAEMKENVYVTIALVKNGSAAVGLQMIGNPTELLEGHQNHQIFPGGYYSQQDWDWLHDPGVTCAADIIQRARQLVERGITREQALPVQNRRVAGPVDIVLVTGCPYLQTFS